MARRRYLRSGPCYFNSCFKVDFHRIYRTGKLTETKVWRRAYPRIRWPWWWLWSSMQPAALGFALGFASPISRLPSEGPSPQPAAGGRCRCRWVWLLGQWMDDELGTPTPRVFLTICRTATFSPTEINYIASLYDDYWSQKCIWKPYGLTSKFYCKNLKNLKFLE